MLSPIPIGYEFIPLEYKALNVLYSIGNVGTPSVRIIIILEASGRAPLAKTCSAKSRAGPVFVVPD